MSSTYMSLILYPMYTVFVYLKKNLLHTSFAELYANAIHTTVQGCNARIVNCSCVYSAYILKPVLSGRNL